MDDSKRINGGIRGRLSSPELSSEFAEALASGRHGFRDVFDLLHIFSERPGRGDHTRATLNPLLVLLAASAWERQWHALALHAPHGKRLQTKGALRLVHRPRGTSEDEIGPAAIDLHELTQGVLPTGFHVLHHQRAVGRKLMRPRRLLGHDFDPTSLANSADFADLGERLNDQIRLRNGVAHRVIGEKMEALGVRSDARSGSTMNTSVARVSVAFFLQLVDQTTEALLTTPPQGITFTAADRKRIRLPRHWLSDLGGGTAARRFAPGELWGHIDLRHQPDLT